MSSTCIKYPMQALVGANVRLAGLKKRSGSIQRGQVVQHHLPEIGMSHLNPTENISSFPGTFRWSKYFSSESWPFTLKENSEVYRYIYTSYISIQAHNYTKKNCAYTTHIGNITPSMAWTVFWGHIQKDHRDEEESSSYKKHLLKHRSLLGHLTSPK